VRQWLRLDEKKSSRIQLSKEFDGYNKDNWPEMIKWLVSNMTQLQKSFKQPLHSASLRLKEQIKAII